MSKAVVVVSRAPDAREARSATWAETATTTAESTIWAWISAEPDTDDAGPPVLLGGTVVEGVDPEVVALEAVGPDGAERLGRTDRRAEGPLAGVAREQAATARNDRAASAGRP